LDLAREDRDSDLLQSLPSQLAIELFDLKLRRESERAFELAKCVLVAPCLLV
jgi:hypothetical protein